MKVLIYKRTHKGDPNPEGIFGINDCMGRVRNWDYDAVIGIGGNSPWKQNADIKHKINWIGLHPKKIKSPDKRGAQIIFEHFQLFEEKGADIKEKYPHLFKYMYSNSKRFDLSTQLPKVVLEEVNEILKIVEDAPKSSSFEASNNESLHLNENFKLRKCRGYLAGAVIEICLKEID